MIFYSCDRCKRVLHQDADLRYVVAIEAFADIQPLDTSELEDDRDHLLEVHELLERLSDEDDCNDSEGVDAHRKLRFDMCADCYREFIKNPMGREAAPLGFSNN